MTDWPDDWFRDPPEKGAGEPASGGNAGSPSGRDLTTRLPYPGTKQQPPGGGHEAVTAPRRSSTAAEDTAASYGSGGLAGGAPGGNWPAQPDLRTKRRPGGRPPGGTGYGGGYGGDYGSYGMRSGWRRWLRPRPILATIAVLLVLALVGGVITYFSLDSQLTRKNVLVNYANRPAAGSGTNWLITGSDSRQGLSRKQERRLATGHDISGRRSDTIMILHLPSGGGRPLLISLPRDSWVPIPGYGMNKINAAYSFGGPKLLAKTVQNVTGLRIEHYMGIGFGGFVRVVNAVGGVRVCLKKPLVDKAAGLHLKAGCQVLSGGKALGFVRSRHYYATQDLQRIQNQRLFLAALLRKLTSFGVLADPFRALPAASNLAGSLTVDKGTHLLSLLSVAFALRHPLTTTVPIANAGYSVNGESAVLWNRAAAIQLFHDLNTGQKVPKSLITGSRQGG